MPIVDVGDLEDSYLHRVQLVWSAGEKKLVVRLQSLSGQWSSLWSYDGDLAAVLGTSRVYYGFIGITASEGHNEWDFRELAVRP